MYVKCGSMEESLKVFERTKDRDTVSWTSLIKGYVDNREEEMALDMFSRMEAQGVKADAVTFTAALSACGSLAAQENGGGVEDGSSVRWKALEKGREIHAQASRLGLDGDIVARNSLIDMYAKCGSTVDSRRVFDRMPSHDLACWTSMVLGYTENGEGELALRLLDQMEGVELDRLALVAALKAVTSVAIKEESSLVDGKLVKVHSLKKGRSLHLQAQRVCCDTDLFVVSRLVDMYAKCGSLKEAREVFDKAPRRDVVLWTALILGYTSKGLEEAALDLFLRMQEDCESDAPSFLAALGACSALAVKESGRKICGNIVKFGSLEKVMAVHSKAVESGLAVEMFLSNTLVDVYAKCGSVLVDSRKVFDGMPFHSVVTWTSLVLGYAENGESTLALELFSAMRLDRSWQPGAQTFVAALKSCGSLAALQPIYVDICQLGMERDEILANLLMDLYGKCGSSMLEAIQIFESVQHTKDIVAWNTIITGFSRRGDTDSVFHLFWKMRDEGCSADGITFACLLSACSHAGLVHRGKRYFETMSREFGVTPSVEHYTCLVDLLGRANELDAAVEIIKAMPVRPSAMVWKALLSSCRRWRNVGVAKLAFEALLDLDEGDAAAYSLMASICSSS